ncbi:MAG: OmpA family protein [Candidatus Tectomicrobia bacterium]|nr:OmpA family protein [Candidatus Tectomicrobia bacterium]
MRGELQNFSDRVRELEGASLEVRATRQSLQEKIGQLRRELEEAVRRKEREVQEIRASHQLLREKLKAEIQRQDVTVRQEKEHITIRLVDRVLFETASAELTERSRKTLEGVYEGLKPIRDGLVVVEGHADDRKIHGRLKGKYPSNWELSLARAVAVVRFLESRGMDPRRMAAAGYSYFRPLDTRLTALGRSRNRRVEIKLIPPGFSVADGAPALMKR